MPATVLTATCERSPNAFPPSEPARAAGSSGACSGSLAAVSLVGLAAPSHADDDYPYRGLGQCPLVPLPPHATHTKPGKPGKPGQPSKPGPHATRPSPADGHARSQPGRPRIRRAPCAKHIWYYNGTYGDPWGFALRNCTSFVAWRLRETNGLTDFSNHVDGGAFGNAEHWDDNAQALGYLVDDVPGRRGRRPDRRRSGRPRRLGLRGGRRHRHRRGVQLLRRRRLRHPHGADLGLPLPPPRRRVPGPEPGLDPRGRDDGSGRRRHLDRTDHAAGRPDRDARPPGDAVHLGPRGVWSTHAAPSVAAGHPRADLGRRGDGGRARAHRAHPRRHRTAWTHPRAVPGGPWSTTSTPTLALDGQGRMQLLTVSAAGDLVERHTTASGPTAGAAATGWGRPARGRPTPRPPPPPTRAAGCGSRSSREEAPSRPCTRWPGARRWSHFQAVDGRTWSATSSPALTLANDGRLWLTAVTARGELFSRHTEAGRSRWHHGPCRHAGVWSPVLLPGDHRRRRAGRLWLAAVRTDGSRASSSSTAAGSARWRPRGRTAQLPGHDQSVLRSRAPAGSGSGRSRAIGRPVWGPGARRRRRSSSRPTRRASSRASPRC